jgi:cytidyltransferase-like protein
MSHLTVTKKLIILLVIVMTDFIHGWLVSVRDKRPSSFLKESFVSIEKYELKKSLTLSQGKKIVLVGGCFDVLHYGHVEFLKNAKNKGDILIVALEPDEKILRFKNRMPIHNQDQRATNIGSIRYVDKVIMLPNLNGFEDYSELLKNINPDIIAVTSDDPIIEIKRMHAKHIGAELAVVIDRIQNLSSSKIVGLSETIPKCVER